MWFKETNFKDSPNGKIPFCWQVVKLEEVNLDVSDGNYSSKYPRQNEFVSKGIPFIRAINIQNGRIIWNDMKFISEEKHSQLQKGHLKLDDILLTTRGEIGTLAYVTEEFVDSNINAQIVRINTKGHIDPTYFFYALLSENTQLQLRKLTTGTTLKQLPVGKLGLLKIPIPSATEQQMIGSILSTVDETIRKTNEVIAKTERLKKGLMQKLLTEGIGHKEFKDTEIGKIPKEWNVVGLGSLVRVQGGFAFKSEDYVKDGVPLVRIANVSFGHIEFADLAKLPYDYLKLYSEFALAENDIVVVLTRPITEGGMKAGMIERIHTPALLNQRVGRFRIKDKTQTSPDFLFHTIFSDVFIGELQRGLVTMNQPNISTKEIEKFTIALPPFEEQIRIAETLSTVDSELGIGRREKAKLERIRQGLMDLLLTGKVRVKVDQNALC